MTHNILIFLTITLTSFMSNEQNNMSNTSNKDIVLYPSIESVFASDLDKCQEVFFPICTIDLGAIKEEWKKEKLHLILYNEDPYNTDRVPSFNSYCKDNMVAFDVIDGKYQFKTDFGYFDLTDDWKQWFDITKKSYLKEKQVYEANPKEVSKDLFNIGGEPNWWQADETPLDPSGEPMEFIAEFGYDESMFYLFYSHKHKLAVQLYQIT